MRVDLKISYISYRVVNLDIQIQVKPYETFIQHNKMQIIL